LIKNKNIIKNMICAVKPVKLTKGTHIMCHFRQNGEEIRPGKSKEEGIHDESERNEGEA
jgi:hypothetical protein